MLNRMEKREVVRAMTVVLNFSVVAAEGGVGVVEAMGAMEAVEAVEAMALAEGEVLTAVVITRTNKKVDCEKNTRPPMGSPVKLVLTHQISRR